MIPCAVRSSTTLRPLHCLSAACRESARPAPWQADAEDSRSLPAKPTRMYELVPMLGKEAPDDLPRVMAENFPIGERAIDCRAHSAEITLADLRSDRRAGELALRQRDAGRFRRLRHLLQIVASDLMAETARAAVNGDHHVVLGEMEGLRGGFIEDIGDHLHFEVVVARAEGAHLPALALLGPFRDAFGSRIPLHALFFDAGEIALLAPSLRSSPTRAAGQHRVHVGRLEGSGALTADACRNFAVERVGQCALHGPNVGELESGEYGAHAAGNVESA